MLTVGLPVVDTKRTNVSRLGNWDLSCEHLGLFRNARWKACLFTAVGILGLIGDSAKAQTQPIFPVATQVSLPIESTPVFTGDFNGDGVPDLPPTLLAPTRQSR